MGGRARKIIEGLQEATQGDFSCVTIDGVRWVRETQSPAVKRQVITDEMVDAVARIVDPLAFLDNEERLRFNASEDPESERRFADHFDAPTAAREKARQILDLIFGSPKAPSSSRIREFVRSR